MKKPQIIADAEANWPEDEASLTADAHANRMQDGYTQEESENVLHRDIAHMHKVFSFEDDTEELVSRYNAALLARGIDVKAFLF